VLAGCAAVVSLLGPATAAERAEVAWHPARPRIGDVAWLHVKNVPEGATVEGSLDGRPLTFFAYAGGHAALVGLDLEQKAGGHTWRVAVLEREREPRTARGQVQIRRRDFPVQRLQLPPAMVEPDPETERRAVLEGQRLQTLYRTITPERLWRGRFTRPVGGTEPATGFGARRIINGLARAPHGGADYSVSKGTPVAEFFFPGRLVILDHGLGLYTLYFHLDSVAVAEGQRLERGQTLGTVGATGRATGPHLHFGAQVGAARVDPAALLSLAVLD
jgi:murein DD-endopeptidase MepM/ murein hydrolase activator NlpD